MGFNVATSCKEENPSEVTFKSLCAYKCEPRFRFRLLDGLSCNHFCLLFINTVFFSQLSHLCSTCNEKPAH